MDNRLFDVLNGKEENYLLPFYWQRGDHTHLIPEQIERIYRSGCRALCVESRPHPDFVGESWWRDMDIILAEAKKREMKVWLLDDDKFPTGHAAGMIAKKHPELRQWELIERHIDVVGPCADASVIYDGEDEENIFLGAYAYKRNADMLETCSFDAVNLTDKVSGHYLNWDIPEGVWRIFFYYRSRKGGRKEYIDMINPDSVRVLIDAVYESHWEHYKEYFGDTFVGFFSDEPEFGNQVFGKERFDFGFYEARVGKHSLALPWNDTVLCMMRERLGYDPIPHLNLLWYEDDENGDAQMDIRHAYMDSITQLYSLCFNKQIADWCHAHGVQYIGHIIEDMNCHLRSGVGHYFRALRWQDMSGIDIVLHQVMPGMSDYLHTVTCSTGVGAPSFYEYILAKLGSSLAHLNPDMQGKAMCEVFGAYGYGEDSVMMKFLMDHLLVRGINHFVPHAFSSKFPDRDCPPHFGAEGLDPSFEAFTALMNYTNKAAHILEGTVHKANAAILYHVDGEWASRFGNAHNMEPAATALMDAHIDYDIVSMDMLKELATVSGGKLCINKESFDALIVPYADHMTEGQLDTLKALAEDGANIWFTEARPENADEFGEVIGLSGLVDKMKSLGFVDVTIPEGYPKLRFYHCSRGKSQIFMFVNEDYSKPIDEDILLPCAGEYARLDLLTDICVSGESEDGTFHLSLLPHQSQIVVFGDKAGLPEEFELAETVPLTPCYKLELAECEELSRFEDVGSYDSFFNVNSPSFKPDFSGKMRYTFTFDAEKRARVYLDLGRVGQNAELTVNGIYCGIRISQPYLYDITNAVKPGENTAIVTVSNTLAQKTRDNFSRFLQLNPSGLLGGVSLKYSEE
ncbi:MAG: glycosyl transferase family 2 [Clostridia bacterium]|nr:glycosyl transferase family 2 [Clostridia bacterium]